MDYYDRHYLMRRRKRALFWKATIIAFLLGIVVIAALAGFC